MQLLGTDWGPLVAHLVGDFILQNDWMAANKKRSSLVCLGHVAAYLLPFLLCGLTWWQLALVGGQHFAQDRSSFVFWWMRVWKRVHPDHFKSVALCVDQTFHVTWITIVVVAGKYVGR